MMKGMEDSVEVVVREGEGGVGGGKGGKGATQSLLIVSHELAGPVMASSHENLA
jgi:hypothetical protein